MKKVKFFLGAIAVLAVTLFAACGPTSTTVDVDFNQSADTVAPGESVVFTLTLNPQTVDKGELGYFKIEAADGTLLYDTTLSGNSSASLEYTYMVDSNATLNEAITLNFSATDGASGTTNTFAAVIFVKDPTPEFAPMVTGQGTVSYSSTNASTELGWQLTADAKGVNVTVANSNDADLVFFFNDSYRQQILSPDATQITNQAAYSSWSYDLTGKKTTKIAPATSTDWDNATDATLDAISISASSTHSGGGNGIENVQLNDVYFIELSDGRKGMFKVIDNDPPYKIESGITLEFKWQEYGSAGK